MNIAKTLIVLFILIGVAVAVIYLMGQFTQTQPIYNKIMGIKDQAVTYIQSNLPLVGGSVASITALGGVAAGLYSKLNSAKQQLTGVTDQAKTQLASLTAEKDKVAATLTGYKTEAEAKLAEAQKQLEAAKASVTSTPAEITALQNQLKGAQDSHTNFIQQLTSGAQSVIDPATNQVYKLITLEKTVVK